MRRILLMLLLLAVPIVQADPTNLDVPVENESLAIKRYDAQGDHLILWVAPGYGTHQRMDPVARALAAAGTEVWHVDLAESLFLTKSTSTMRSLDGRMVAGLVERAHEMTGKQITLISRSYGGLPVLRGVRLWQQRHGETTGNYLSGVILFSPELYSEIPSLGLPPVFDSIVDATNAPLMIYQAEKRNNSQQFDELTARLQAGGSRVFLKHLPGVLGLFYEEDVAPATLRIHASIAPHILRMSALLQAQPMPRQVLPLAATPEPEQHGLDTELKAYRGRSTPPILDLTASTGRRIRYADYQGKVTVVNFWATWCGPCVEEIPSLNRLRARMSGKPFELISVDYMERVDEVQAFMRKVAVDFPVLMDIDGSTARQWGALVFPSTFVVGPDGQIVQGVNGALHWDSEEVITALESLLGNTPTALDASDRQDR